ncbi:MAG: SDR family NAD(P)-dependent oxidoreductase [Chthoniobacteraceae bacterium]
MKTPIIKSVLITGANTGVGKEVARQLAAKPGVETIYLACRNEAKALDAQRELETSTGRKIFKIILMDLSSVTAVRGAVAKITEPVNAVILNAGGTGGKTPLAITSDGVTHVFAQNVLGHAVLLESLLRQGRLTQAAIYVGSEAARGFPKLRMKRPDATTPEALRDIITGNAKKADVFSAYGAVKYIGALWMSSLAREYPQIRLVTISPGGTKGTNAYDSMPTPLRIFAKIIFKPILSPLMGLEDSLENGARRIADGLFDQSLQSGHFYASSAKVLTGPIVDQSEIFANFGNPALQDMAATAVREFVA